MKRNVRELDARFFFAENLLEGEVLYRLQSLLKQEAPQWSAALHLKSSGTRRIPIDLVRSDALLRAVRSVGSERGPLYEALSGARGDTREFGSVELRGSSPELTVVVSFDETAFPGAGSLVLWGNTITFQMRRARVEGIGSPAWTRRAFTSAVEMLPPSYGHAETSVEFDSKNLLSDDGGTSAVGVDISKALPGLYWLNYFGSRLCKVLGMARLQSAPAARTFSVGGGVLLELADRPDAWKTVEYRERERQVLRHIGREYFFSKDESRRNMQTPLDFSQVF